MDERPRVFQPLRIAGLLLRNRMVGLPIGLSGVIDGYGAPTERMIALYRQRAAGGAGLITVEIATVEPHACPQAGLLRFDSDRHIPAFSLLVDAIHEAGAAAAQCSVSGSGMAQAQCARMWVANPPRWPTMVACTCGHR